MLRKQRDDALEDSMNDSSVNNHNYNHVISAFNIEDPVATRKYNEEVAKPTDSENINAKPKYDKYKLPDLSI